MTIEVIERQKVLISNLRDGFNKAINDTTQFINNNAGLAKEYNAHTNRVTDFGFNIFNLISDTYYRENYHSDILRAFLDPNEKHNEGYKYLHMFLEFINKQSDGTKVKINTAFYKNTRVVREQGKVDILILDADSMKAVILENKINRAADMPRQIPRYVEYVEKLNYKVDAIVYLVLDGNDSKKPETNTWNNGDKENIMPWFVCIPAFDEQQSSLHKDWLLPCQKATQNGDALFLLKQYASLIQKLGENNMNKPIMNAFLKSMLEGENYETALSLKSMLGELNNYRAEKIVDTFRTCPEPFDHAYTHAGTAVLGHWKTMRLVVQIYLTDDTYKFTFFDRDFRDGITQENLAEASVQQIKYESHFTKGEDGTMKKMFKFPSEEENLYKFITEFNKMLGTLESAKATRIKG